MAQIIKFPVQASKFGYKRVRKRKRAEDPDQLQLFGRPTADILTFLPEGSCFEQALRLDERNDSRAAHFYQKAIEQGECIADAYCNLGILESQTGNIARAFDCFTASLKQDPRHFEAHYNLGNLYFEVNDLRLAQVHYELAAEVDAGFANVYFNLALVQAINNEFAPAIDALTRYQELVSESEARVADELLLNLKRSLDASKGTRFGSR